MRTGRVFLFYAEEYGIVLAESIPVAGQPIRTIMNPVNFTMDEISTGSFGRSVLDSLHRSANISPMEKDKSENYWHITGIKDYKRFSKVFGNIKVSLDDSGIRIEQMKTARVGGYAL